MKSGSLVEPEFFGDSEMNGKDVVQSLALLLQDVRRTQPVVAIDALLSVLSQWEAKLPELSEYQKTSLQKDIENLKATHASRIESFKAVIEFGKVAVSTSVLLNGGAAIAVLSLLGNFSTNRPAAAALLANPIFCWAIGALVAGVSASTAYLAQNLYTQNILSSAGNRWRVATMILVFLSYFCFSSGVWLAVRQVSTALPS